MLDGLRREDVEMPMEVEGRAEVRIAATELLLKPNNAKKFICEAQNSSAATAGLCTFTSAQAIQNQIRSSQLRGTLSGQCPSNLSISALPLHKSISLSLRTFVRLMSLYPKNKPRKMGMSMYGGMKVFALNLPGKKASKPLKRATMLQKHTPK